MGPCLRREPIERGPLRVDALQLLEAQAALDLFHHFRFSSHTYLGIEHLQTLHAFRGSLIDVDSGPEGDRGKRGCALCRSRFWHIDRPAASRFIFPSHEIHLRTHRRLWNSWPGSLCCRPCVVHASNDRPHLGNRHRHGAVQ